ncbi:tektin-2-like [Frankliniella occidentalis]|uniref:Tektin n=1 Tax=Frankliniella occidentalis TaxID=133901 RepID=A0A6J1RZV8_FRAOC|nr:tektin-2-like [Frankliniella occidentalis]XP_026277134.2 tektin-2-like [Frankliniella occidentalis]
MSTQLSLSSQLKPLQHLSKADWQAGVWALRQCGQTARHDGFRFRNDARTLRNETRVRTKWDAYHNDCRLADRVTEVGRWQEILGRCLRQVEAEQRDLAAEKEICEQELESIATCFLVEAECQAIIDRRVVPDLVDAEREQELKDEIAALEAHKAMLTERCHAAFEQHNRLEEAACSLRQATRDQDDTLEIDHDNLARDRSCAGITFKPDPTEIVNNIVPYESWLDHCRCTKLRGDNELASSAKLREAMQVARARARNDLTAHKDATEFAMRKCVYETQRAKNELEWQKMNLKEAMARLHKEIADLTNALRDKTECLMLAETRLENRKYRPGLEQARDEPMVGLCDEVLQLRRTMQELQDRLDHAKATYNGMEDLLVATDKDLSGKILALTAAIHCLDTHKRFAMGDAVPFRTETSRNVALTKVENEVARH